MKIYFTAATRDVPGEIQQVYPVIIDALRELGHVVSADHIVGETAEAYLHNDDEAKEFVAVLKKMVAHKKQADIVVVEATHPSFSVGQEISYSLQLSKPVIVLYRKEVSKPRLLRSLNGDRLYTVAYERSELKSLLSEFISNAKDMADTRFNFFISPQIATYLDWVAKDLRTPRAVYLRDLIENEMGLDEEYTEGISS